MSAAADNKPAAVVLDVSLPDMDGFAACKALRDQGVKAPIIMLTGAAQEEEQQVQGLDAGANDYVLKPFKFSVLLARIRAHLRSHEASEDAVYRIGPYEFRPAMRLLVHPAQKKVRLTDKEASILRYLYRSGEKPVGRFELDFDVVVVVDVRALQRQPHMRVATQILRGGEGALHDDPARAADGGNVAQVVTQRQRVAAAASHRALVRKRRTLLRRNKSPDGGFVWFGK